MGAPRLFRIPRPEGGDERGVFWFRNHGCAMAKMLKESGADDNVDLVVFPVGLVGEGMPVGIPFEVTTTTPCEACEKYLRAWFEWHAPGIHLLGR